MCTTKTKGQTKEKKRERERKSEPDWNPGNKCPRRVYEHRGPQNDGESRSQGDSGTANRRDPSRRDFKTKSAEYLIRLNILGGNFYSWSRV